jgi:23S rRNA pseudouridine2605 synthase
LSEERIQKLLARAGVASRRKVEELLGEGLVTVNGQVAAVGDKADPERDAIKVDGKRVDLRPAIHRYLLLNKPLKVMSTVDDPEGRPTVMDLVPPQFRKALVPVGRLDFLTEGLLLLTDDGELAHRVGHPRFGCTKMYEVKVKGLPSADGLRKVRQGTVIDGKRTVPHQVVAIRKPGPKDVKNSWWRVELGEGRNREIREMFFRIGHPVSKLRRVAIGPITDAGLPVGALRELTEAEVAALRRATSRVRKPLAPESGGTSQRTASPPLRARPAAPEAHSRASAGRPESGGSGWGGGRRASAPESAGTSREGSAGRDDGRRGGPPRSRGPASGSRSGATTPRGRRRS